MSEPLSSNEIEDVLSSIRRLVSDDMRPAPRAVVPQHPTPARRTEAEVPGDKLILTPALRVVAEEPADSVAPLMLNRRDDPVAPAEPSLVDVVVATFGASINAQRADWEQEGGEIAPLQHPLRRAEPLPQALADHDDATVPEAPMIEILAEGAEMTPQDPPVDDIPGWAQNDASSPTDEPEETMPPAAPPVRGVVEPDADWADAAEASVIAALAAEDAPPETYALPPDAADELPDAQMLFDESVLRELVRDMLREELAGKMGERITRNIRKLVRAEIARMTAARDLQ